MGLDDGGDVCGITTAHRAGNADTGFPTCRKDHFIACPATFKGEGEPSQLVRGQDIHPALIQDHLRLEFGHEGVQDLVQTMEVIKVTSAIGQCDVEGALRLVQRIVIGPMHAEGKDAVLLSCDVRGAIALVDIQVDDANAFHTTVQKVISGDGEVIEEAKAFCMTGKGVVRSTGDVQCNTSLSGFNATQAGPFHDGLFSIDQGLGPWES